ncbi:MAG TPA: TerC family protein, partial [Tepidisphaeraceae bacterium]|nr:TerC family protein [Tepidisphaeraceae bacterium]
MIWMWIGFIAFVIAMLMIDLGVFHHKAHVVKLKEALLWSLVWVTMALLFNIFIYHAYQNHWEGLGLKPSLMHPTGLGGSAAATLFFTGYLMEKSLSMDNIFVIALVFAYFKIPAVYQHRVLYWGILGALVMRGTMIGLGAALIERFSWILYIFGAFLVFTGIKMLFPDNDPDPGKNPLVRLVRRFFPICDNLHGQHFLAHIGGKWMFTPLALTLVVVESTDVVFAVDSIPAVFAITTDPFLVFTSNVFAILGLRALYFALAQILDMFHYLKYSLAAILCYVGVKMLIVDYLKQIDWLKDHLSLFTLGVIIVFLAAGIIASLLVKHETP